MAIKKVTKSNLQTFFENCKQGHLIKISKSLKFEDVEEKALAKKFRLLREHHKKEGEIFRLI